MFTIITFALIVLTAIATAAAIRSEMNSRAAHREQMVSLSNAITTAEALEADYRANGGGFGARY